jgi:hypothetical protein
MVAQYDSNADKTYYVIEGNKLLDSKPNVDGTPYLYPFMNAKVKDVAGVTKMRYNAYNDEVEYQTENGDLALLKQPKFGDIYFTEYDLHLKLVNYNYNNATITGYLFELVDKPNLKIYKREHINYYDAKTARNSYDAGSPPSFKVAEPVYFIQKNGGPITELPSNKKKLIALFPDKKEAIIQYFKNNKGDFSKKNDLEKLADIL